MPIHKQLLCILLLLIPRLIWAHAGYLEFEVKLEDGNVCQIFYFRGERMPRLDECVLEQDVINQNIQVIELMELTDQLGDLESLQNSGIDPLDIYDVTILPENIKLQINNVFSRLTIKALSVIQAENVEIDGDNELLIRFVAAVDWKTKSGDTGISYIEGEVLDLSEETLIDLTEHEEKEMLHNMLAPLLKKRTKILGISSNSTNGTTLLSDEYIQDMVAPIIAMELTFVLNLRILRDVIQYIDSLIEESDVLNSKPDTNETRRKSYLL